MATVIPPERPVLRARYELRRHDVIGAAATLFAEQGYQATSIADLTAATGLTAGGLYHYIGNKEKLLLAICDELLAPLLEQAREIVARPDPPRRRLRDLLRAWLAHIETHRDHMLSFTQERQVLERDPEWRAIRRQRKAFERLLDEVLAAGEADGTMSFDDRGLTLLALLGMVNYSPQWTRPRGRLSAEQIADGYWALILGVSSRRPPGRDNDL
jgi:AcrR family transcriptional regulator